MVTRALARGGGGRRKALTTGKFAAVGGHGWGEEGGQRGPDARLVARSPGKGAVPNALLLSFNHIYPRGILFVPG